MKFNLKSIVAAVAMTVASASAMASIQSGTAVGGSELVFFAFDDIAGTSYVKDLGVTFNNALPTLTYGSLNNVGSDSNWGSYKGSVGNDLGNTRWGILANVVTNPVAAGSFMILTTARNNTTVLTAQTSGNLTAIDGSFNTIFRGALGDASAVGVNNSYFAAASNLNSDNWSQFLKSNVAGKLKFNTDNLVDTANVIASVGGNAAAFTANMYQESRAALNNAVPTITTTATQWQFDGDTLTTVSAVPEPETYGMLLAGLALIGTVVRRRRA